MLDNAETCKAIVELLVGGQITGMGRFWEEFNNLRGLPDNQVLGKMARFAIEEAIDLLNKQAREGV